MLRCGRQAAAFLAIATILVLPALTPAPADASKLETFSLPSPLVDPAAPGSRMERKRTAPRVHVLLPDGYDPKPGRDYPVLWLLHGANGGTDSWIPGVKKIAAGLDAIVVMPDGGLIGMYMDWWNGGTRGGPSWASYHLNVLRDEIDRRYAIRPGRRWHTIGGISMGGQGTLRYAAMLPGYFGAAVALSAALPDMRTTEAQIGVGVAAAANGNDTTYESVFGPPTGPYAEGTSAMALAANYAHTRMYLTSGNGVSCPGDRLTGTYALDIATESAINGQRGTFAAAARGAGADVTSVSTCGVHTFGVWERAWPRVRAWGFFRPVPEAPRQWTYRTIAQRGEAWDLRFAFTQPPARLVAFGRDGDRLRAAGAGNVTLTNEDGCSASANLPFDISLPPSACGQHVRMTARRGRRSRGRRYPISVSVTYQGRDGRLPLAGATVRARSGREARKARTDAAGRVRIRMRSRKAIRLRVAKRGYAGAVRKIRRAGRR